MVKEDETGGYKVTNWELLNAELREKET